MCGCRYTTITKVMTLGSHKKGGTAGVHRCLGLVPQVTLLLLFCGKTHGTFMVSYGKWWKKLMGKKNTNYGKTHGKPRIWWLIIIWPSFHGFILGGIHQFQRHTHNHPYVIVRNPIPLIKLNITWSNYEPPTQSDGIEGDLPWFTDISDFFGLLRECLISRGWDYNTTQPGKDGRCEGSSNAPVSGLLIGFKSTNCPYKFWF